MRITKLFSQMIYCGAFSSISVFTFAQEPLTHDHLREHGGQIYQATKLILAGLKMKKEKVVFLLN
jgi:copper resistance protein B